MPKNCWLLAPRAPYASEEGGYSWVESARSLDVPFEEYIKSARRVVEWIDQLDELPSHVRQKAHLVGFSQGAAVCYALALTHPHRIGRLAGLSGFMPSGAEMTAADRPLQGKTCLIAHGTLDQRVPISRAREAVRVLETAGAVVHYCEDKVGHKISASCFKRLQTFLDLNKTQSEKHDTSRI